MSVRIDFLGTARGRAGVSHIHLKAQSLGGIIQELGSLYPRLGEILPSEQSKGFILISRNSQNFIENKQEMIQDGETLILLGADAGG